MNQPGRKREPVEPPDSVLPSSLSSWLLTAQGAAIHRPSRTAIIADVHLGYEWVRRARGDAVPAHSLAESIGRLDRLLAAYPVESLVVAGDLVESLAPGADTVQEVRQLAEWLASRSVRLTLVRGNHDPRVGPMAGLTVVERVEMAGWVIVHGHRPSDAARLVLGHFHPRLTLVDPAGVPLGAACFLAHPRAIVLPAFSPNAAGVSVWALAGSAEFRRCLPAGVDPFDLSAHVPAGEQVLGFGPVRKLRRRP